MPGSAGNHGILLLARMAQLVDAEERRDSKKRKTAAAGGSGVGAAQGAEDGGERGAGGSGAENADREVIWRYLTPSDLRLTPEALISTKVSHFRCNLNGCPRFFALHGQAAARLLGIHAPPVVSRDWCRLWQRHVRSDAAGPPPRPNTGQGLPLAHGPSASPQGEAPRMERARVPFRQRGVQPAGNVPMHELGFAAGPPQATARKPVLSAHAPRRWHSCHICVPAVTSVFLSPACLVFPPRLWHALPAGGVQRRALRRGAQM